MLLTARKGVRRAGDVCRSGAGFPGCVDICVGEPAPPASQVKRSQCYQTLTILRVVTNMAIRVKAASLSWVNKQKV